MNMTEKLNIQCISAETHAVFDAFAEKVMEHQLVELLNPAQGL